MRPSGDGSPCATGGCDASTRPAGHGPPSPADPDRRSSWSPPAVAPRASPTPAPTPVPAATPVPTPSPSPSRRRRQRGLRQGHHRARLQRRAAEIGGAMSIAGTDGTIGGDALMIDDSSQSNTIMTIAGTTESTDSIEQSEKSPGGGEDLDPAEPGAVGRARAQGRAVDSSRPSRPCPGSRTSASSRRTASRSTTSRPRAATRSRRRPWASTSRARRTPSFTLDFYATEDGTPAIIAVNGSWTQDSGGTAVPVGVDVEYVLSEPSASAVHRPATGPLDPLHVEALQVRRWPIRRSGRSSRRRPRTRTCSTTSRVRLRRARAEGRDDDDREVRRRAQEDLQAAVRRAELRDRHAAGRPGGEAHDLRVQERRAGRT